MKMAKKEYKNPIKSTDMKTLYSLIAPVLEQGSTVKMKVSGFSMYPLVVSRRDSVLLGKAEEIKVGDVPLFQRKDQSFILHRIVGEKNGAFIVMGDYETKQEYPVYKEQIVAVAKGFYRNERFISCDSFWYRVYSAFWRRTLWMRPMLLKGIKTIVRIKGKIRKNK